jgi:hypothetical protein
MNSTIMIAAGVAAGLLGGAAPAGGIVYEQALDRDNLGRGFFSTPQPSAFVPNLHADNFTLEAAADIATVGWFGFSENLNFADLANMPAWEITIYEDSSFQPGAVVHSDIISREDTNPVDTGLVIASGARIFSHDAELSSTVSLDAGTQYWISIGAYLEIPGADNWIWQDSVFTDDNSANYDNVQDDEWFNVGFDSAFSLGVIPGPGALAMFGAAGLLGRSCRRS